MSRNEPKMQSNPPSLPPRDVQVSPFYHAARNEIVRPDRGIVCTEYFLRHWTPRLGATASLIVLFLRNEGRSVPGGEARVQVSQQQIAAAAACSLTTLYRELKQNAELGRFLRTEERYARNDKGHVRQVESVYYIAMDDPLIPEDEPRLQEILQRQPAQTQETSAMKVILTENVVLQNEGLRAVVLQNEGQPHEYRSFKLKDKKRSFKLTEQNPLGTNVVRNVSETRFREEMPETKEGHKSSEVPKRGEPRSTTSTGEAWRKETEDLARYSAQELDDLNSLGFHINVWNHARKIDRQRGGKPIFADAVFDILRELSARRKAGSPPQAQGRAWTRRTRKWFNDNGFPLLVKADAAELEEVRSALAGAPFLTDCGDA